MQEKSAPSHHLKKTVYSDSDSRQINQSGNGGKGERGAEGRCSAVEKSDIPKKEESREK